MSQNYDFNTPVEKTSTELAKGLIKKFAESADILLIENYEKADPAVKTEFIEKSTDFSIEVLKMISASDIPYPYASRCIDKITQVLLSLQKYIDGTVEQTRHEIASRFLEVKSPDNNKYTEEMATLGTLLLKLDGLRQSQGNNMNDYFTTQTEETVEDAEEDENELGKYKVIGEIIPQDQNGNQLEALEIDSIQEVPTKLGDGWVAQGLAEKVELSTENSSAEAVA